MREVWTVKDSRRVICWGRGGGCGGPMTAVEEPFGGLLMTLEEPIAGRGEERCGGLLMAVEEPFVGGEEERCGLLTTVQSFH